MRRILLCLLGLAACAQPQKPYFFSSPPQARDPIESLAAAMSSNGLMPVVVDPSSKMVQTRWEDTGLRNGIVKERPATIVRRYTVTLQHSPSGNDVTVRANAQRCMVGSFTLGEFDVQGTCEPMDRLLPQHLDELYRLGGRISQAMNIP